VRALTGTDPDRLKEEKERGITIELGFAHCELGEGVVASFVDVPGHERFVRHMLAGAHGIDAVALVVAADESVMPQTREHFHICRLLGVPRGLVVLTKCDAADADSQAIAELEARELVAGSFLEAAPVVHVSARTGEGLPGLREALLALAHESPPRPLSGLLRLPVDRVFSMKGFGVVITGTLVTGDLATGEEVEALPSGRRARVRGLQVHGETVERAAAGTRTAVNLAGDVEGLARGEVLARPGTLRATSMIDALVSLLPGARPLADGARVRVHAASAEVLARVRLLGAESLEPGKSALAQLRLESPAVAGRGDRLVLRSYSPADTIAGALVVDPQGVIVYANPRTKQLFGYDEAELLGRQIGELVPERFRPDHHSHRARFHENPSARAMGTSSSSVFGLRKDGTEFPIDVRLSAIDTPSGRRVISIVRARLQRRAAVIPR